MCRPGVSIGSMGLAGKCAALLSARHIGGRLVAKLPVVLDPNLHWAGIQGHHV